MGQRLVIATKKDRSKVKGMATRLPKGQQNNLTLKDVFMAAFFNKSLDNGKSKSKDKSKSAR